MTRREFIKTGLPLTMLGGVAMGSIVRSSIGGRQILTSSNEEEPIPLPYVTDGLEAFWDGEWNIGFEQHNDTTNYWIDLSGHKHHMYAPAPMWEENYAYCDGKTMNQIFRQTAQEAEWFADIAMSGRYTIEIVQGMNTTRGDPYFFCNGSEGNFALRGTAINANNSGFKISMNNSNNAVLCTVNGINYLSNRCHQFAADVSVGMGGVNGNYSSYEGNFVVSTYLRSRGIAIGARGDLYSTPYYSGGLCIYRVAIYSRALTQEELEFNFALDQERFFT